MKVAVRSGRVIDDNSILARPDGSFYDFNGSQNFVDVAALAIAHPELIGDGDYIAPANNRSSTHDAANVTKAVRVMKSQFKMKILDEYLPLYTFERIRSNVGATRDGHLAVFMWIPTTGGASAGSNYGLAQYRGSSRSKWMSVKGTDAKSVESVVTDNDPVYVSFGMGDFLILKSTGLNYLCFAGDGGAKNSPHADYIREKVGNREVRLLADNDVSGQGTAEYLREYDLHVSVLNWSRLKSIAYPKMDVRDLAMVVKERGGNLEDLTALIEREDLYK